MMPICFNVSVYQMDSKQQVVEPANSSVMDTVFSQDDERNIDTSFVEEVVVENPSSLSVTHKDVKAMQALEYTDFSHTSTKDNTDMVFPVLGGFPMYRLTLSQARKSNQKKIVLLFVKKLIMFY